MHWCVRKLWHSRLKQVLNRFHLGKAYISCINGPVTFYNGNCKCKSDNRIWRIYPAENDLRSCHESAGRRWWCPNGAKGFAGGWQTVFEQRFRYRKMADLFLLPFLVAAKQERINGFNIREENGFRVLLDKPMVLHADGEYCGDVTRVEFRCLEKRLWLLHEKEGD